MDTDTLNIGIAQIAPVWLDRKATIEKVCASILDASAKSADLVAFGEALVPGYPLWVERTDGARFNSDLQKNLYAHYVDQAVDISGGDLDPVCAAAKESATAVYLGTIEKDPSHRGTSLYCTMVYIGPDGVVGSTHRKLVPTYEERLVWSPGDGNGLRTHSLGAFTVGGLNCWENWMPLPRAALYAQGEDLHVAIWPGSIRNTHDITRFIAKESRSYVLSVSALNRREDIPSHIPHAELLTETSDDVMTDGGSCIAGPDGEWIAEPVTGEEIISVHTISHQRVREERQNLDVRGHYSRPDVTELVLNRQRQSTLRINEET